MCSKSSEVFFLTLIHVLLHHPALHLSPTPSIAELTLNLPQGAVFIKMAFKEATLNVLLTTLVGALQRIHLALWPVITCDLLVCTANLEGHNLAPEECVICGLQWSTTAHWTWLSFSLQSVGCGTREMVATTIVHLLRILQDFKRNRAEVIFGRALHEVVFQWCAISCHFADRDTGTTECAKIGSVGIYGLS